MKLMILDLDDTLLDNKDLDLDSFKYIIKTFNLKKIDDLQIIKWRKKGMIAKNILKRMISNKKNVDLESCIKRRLIYLKHGEKKLKLVKSRNAVIDTLKEIKKHDYFIVITTSRENKNLVKKIIQYVRISPYIDKIYCNENYKQIYNMTLKDRIVLKEKLYNLALQDFNKISNKKIIVIGNLKADIIASKRLKITPIGIKGTYRFDSGIFKLTKTIEDFQDILNFL